MALGLDLVSFSSPNSFGFGAYPFQKYYRAPSKGQERIEWARSGPSGSFEPVRGDIISSLNYVKRTMINAIKENQGTLRPFSRGTWSTRKAALKNYAP